MSKSGRPSLVVPMAATFAGVVLGVFLAKAKLADAVTEEVGGERTEPVTALLKSSLASAVTAKPFLRDLQNERQLASIDIADFPRLMANELRNATDSGLAFKIAARWAERDPDRFLEWLQQGRGTFSLREAGYGLGLANVLIRHLAKVDPERAWEVAGKLPGRSGYAKSSILLGLLKEEPERAVELARAHRVEISMRNDGYWGAADPVSLQPILEELFPGPARDRMVREVVRHYLERNGNPATLAESVEWFSNLSPALQKVARDSTSRSILSGDSDRKRLLKAWEEAAPAP